MTLSFMGGRMSRCLNQTTVAKRGRIIPRFWSLEVCRFPSQRPKYIKEARNQFFLSYETEGNVGATANTPNPTVRG